MVKAATAEDAPGTQVQWALRGEKPAPPPAPPGVLLGVPRSRSCRLTCLWINLRGEVCGRGARGEVVAAVGDEGRQRVHVVRVLNDRNFIRLKDTEKKTRDSCQGDGRVKSADSH